MNPYKNAEIQYENYQKGISEPKFYEHLVKVFGDEIMIDKVTEIFKYKEKYNYPDYDFVDEDNNYSLHKTENAYCPDFIFSHFKTKMTIDIEIDEPYDSKFKAIHTTFNYHDEKRNKYFNNLNWFVIRFSERQVLKNPDSCCLEIANLIFDFTGDDKYFEKIKSNKLLNREIVWNDLDALGFAKLNRRKNYEDFNEKFLQIDANLLLSPLKCKNKKYCFNRKFEFIETDLLTQKVLDEGKFQIQKNQVDRYKMTINWKDGKTEYLLNQVNEHNLLLTDFITREQFIFEKIL